MASTWTSALLGDASVPQALDVGVGIEGEGGIHDRSPGVSLAQNLGCRPLLLRDVQGDEPAALEALGRAVALAHPGRWLRLFADLGPGLAALLHRLEVEGDALRYVAEILAAFQGESREGSGESLKPASGSQPLPDPLTPRELEILGLLAERLSGGRSRPGSSSRRARSKVTPTTSTRSSACQTAGRS